MNPDNFIVRAHLQHVEKFTNEDAWDSLTDDVIHEIENHVAGLPSQIGSDDVEARFFDLSALRMQIALVEKDAGTFESTRRKVIEIAASLERRRTPSPPWNCGKSHGKLTPLAETQFPGTTIPDSLTPRTLKARCGKKVIAWQRQP